MHFYSPTKIPARLGAGSLSLRLREPPGLWHPIVPSGTSPLHHRVAATPRTLSHFTGSVSPLSPATFPMPRSTATPRSPRSSRASTGPLGLSPAVATLGWQQRAGAGSQARGEGGGAARGGRSCRAPATAARLHTAGAARPRVSDSPAARAASARRDRRTAAAAKKDARTAARRQVREARRSGGAQR